VNAYAEPVVTLDLDFMVAIQDLGTVRALLEREFDMREHAHNRMNISAPGSDPRVQVQTDPRCGGFPARASRHDVLGLRLPVASPEDILQGRVWAVQDESRRPGKRQKDLADIARFLEAFPALRDRVPADVLSRLP